MNGKRDDLRELVLLAADRLQLIDTEGQLARLDSIAYVDLAVELEDLTRMKIPTTNLTPQHFDSLDTVTEMLLELSR